MDPKIKGKTVGRIADDVIQEIMEEHKDGYGDGSGGDFANYGYERISEFILEHARTDCSFAEVKRKGKQILKEYLLQNQFMRADTFVHKICSKYAEENDKAYEWIRERVIEHLEESDIEDLPKRTLENTAEYAAADFFNKY